MAHPGDEKHKLIGRTEQVIVDGILMRQVLDLEAMTPGSFCADPLQAHALFVWLDKSDSPAQHTIEASVRPASKVTLPPVELADTLPVKVESPVTKATFAVPAVAFRLAVPTLALLAALIHCAKGESKTVVKMFVKDAQIESALRKAKFKPADSLPLVVRKLTARRFGGNVHHFPAWRIVGGDIDAF